MGKRTFRLTVLLSAVMFLALFVSMFVSISLISAFLRFRLISWSRRAILMAGAALSGVVISGFLARALTDKVLAPILEISEATKRVAKGDFHIELKRASRAEEVNEMARNFLLMAQELSGIETFRTDFISNVSHEFKTPLSAIEGYAVLLQNPALSQEKREFYLGKILHNTRRLSSLTGNILQLSRLENQEIMPQPERFSLDEQLRQVILTFEDTWTQKGLDLDISLDSVDCTGHRDLLAQVWQNLIGNAVKFTPCGGSVGVHLRNDGTCARIQVTDSGPGMSAEVQARIFEKFYQGDSSRSQSGNGLGLTLVKRIVDLHQGSIQVSSQEGKGASFTVTLPVSKEEQYDNERSN